MAFVWYYTIMGKQAGPVAFEELKQLAGAGSLGPKDHVWSEGTKVWIEAGSLPALLTSMQNVQDSRVSASGKTLPAEFVPFVTAAEPAQLVPFVTAADSEESCDDANPELTISCAKCSKRLRVPRDRLGQTGRCPQCHAMFQVARGKNGALAVLSVLEMGASLPAEDSEDDTQIDAREKSVTLPLLTETAAVVECPSCKSVVRVPDRLFNRQCVCPRCQVSFVTVFVGENRIPYDCPHCGEELESPAKESGRKIRCVDCRKKVLVPTSPVLVRLARAGDKATPSSSAEFIAVAAGALILAAALGSRGSVARTCVLCGRYIRNPSSYCYRCQRLL